MNVDKNNIKIVVAVLVGLAVFLAFINNKKDENIGGTFTFPFVFTVASSSAYTISNTSTQILATTTTPRRVAASVQLVNCTIPGSAAYLRMNNDAEAIVNTGIAVFSSSTANFSAESPIVQSGVRAIVGAGTCTLLVTEWRTQY